MVQLRRYGILAILILMIFAMVPVAPVVSAKTSINVDFENALLEDVIRAISEQSDLNIVLGKNAGMDQAKNYTEPIHVNVSLKDVTPDQALWTICNSLDLRLYKYGQVYFIENPSLTQSAPEHLKTEVVTIELGDLSANEVSAIITNIISAVGKLTMFKDARTVVVKDYPENIAKIREIIDFLKYNHYKSMTVNNKITYDRKSQLRLENGRVVFLPQPGSAGRPGSEMITLGEFCDFISSQINKPIFINATDRVLEIKFPIKYVEPYAALREVVKTLLTSMTDDGKTISVGSNFLVTEVIKLDHISLSLQSPVQNQDVAVRTIEPSQSYIVPILTQMLANITPVGMRSTLSVDIKTNSVLVTAPFYIIEQFRNDVIGKLDIPKQQILIEAYFLSMNEVDAKDIGFDWTLQDNNGIPLYTANVDLDFGYTNNLSVNFNHDFYDITAYIDFLVSKNKAKIISKPRVMVLDNEMAVIQTSQNVWYLEPVVTVSNGVPQVTNTPKQADVGVKLSVTPRLEPDGLIHLEIYPEVNAMEGNQNLGGNNYPVITRKYASTTFKVKNNNTVAIGGLLQEKSEEKVNKLPVLGDIPLLGKLFRKTEIDKINDELIIFVTPHIVGKGIPEPEITNPDIKGVKREIPKYAKPVVKAP